MNPFELFELSIKYDLDADYIRKKYFNLARQKHPDHDGDIKYIIQLNKAYQILLDPILRAECIFHKNGLVKDEDMPADIEDLILDADKNYIRFFNEMESAFFVGNTRAAYDKWLRCKYLAKFIHK